MLVQVSESNADRRTITFQLVGTDGISPANGEDGGQPQIRVIGDAGGWTDTGIGTLTFRGNGSYDATLTTDAIDTVGTRIIARYKSASTAECPANELVEVVAYDPFAAVGVTETIEGIAEFISDAP